MATARGQGTSRRCALALGVAAIAASAGIAAAAVAGPTDASREKRLEAGDAIPGQLLVRMRGQERDRILTVPASIGDQQALQALRRNPNVASASRDYVVRVAAPPAGGAGGAGTDDPGQLGVPGGWADDQWHLLGTAGGIDVGPAWAKLITTDNRYGRYSSRERGPIVAVVDTGVAFRYADGGRFRRNPDLPESLFVGGRDFVDLDRRPLDEFGHGTHMTGTIAEGVNNSRGVRGIAPGVRLMPVRVLDRFGFGQTSTVARGVRWASEHGARIINTSIEYGGTITDCDQIPALCRAIRDAIKGGAIVVAAGGNSGRGPVPLPSRTLVVGAATIRGCLAAYSNRGSAIDLLAPGGGRDADGSGVGCDPQADETPGIVQLTVTPRRGRYDRFAYPRTVGTSSAAAHVSGVTALILASQQIGRFPGPRKVAEHLQATGRPAVGLPPETGSPVLLDAAAALGA